MQLKRTQSQKNLVLASQMLQFTDWEDSIGGEKGEPVNPK